MKNKKLESFFNDEILPTFKEIDRQNEEFKVKLIQETMRKFRELDRPKVQDKNNCEVHKDIDFIEKENLRVVPHSIYRNNLYSTYVPSEFQPLSDEEQLIWEKEREELWDKTDYVSRINLPKWLANEKKSYEWNLSGYITYLINENNKKFKENKSDVTYSTKEEIQAYEEKVEDLLAEFICTLTGKKYVNLPREMKDIKVKHATFSSYLSYYYTGRGSALSAFIFRKFIVAYANKKERENSAK